MAISKNNDELSLSKGPIANRRKTRRDLKMFNYMKFAYTNKEEHPGGFIVDDHHLDHDNELTTKEIMHHMMHSRPVHITVLSLVLIDSIFVLFELLIDFKVIKLDYHSSPIPHVLHGFSIAILGIFVIEICMKIYAEFNHFIHHKIELLDGIVVFVSFGLDVFTAFVHDKNLIGIVGGLLIFRFWRIVRIINGVIVAVKDRMDRHLRHEEHKVEILVKKIKSLVRTSTQQRSAIEELVTLLEKQGFKVGGQYLDELMERKLL